jgi:hypothetical protein
LVLAAAGVLPKLGQMAHQQQAAKAAMELHHPLLELL